MPNYTAKDVQTLRQMTGVGMMDAKKALDETNGDIEEAAKALRISGLAGAAKRQEREASQGAVSATVHDNVAAIVELRCETDYVAKSADFVSLVDELTAMVAAKGTEAVAELQGEVDQLNISLKENISVGRVVRLQAGPDGVADTYLHVQADRGVNAVAVILEGGSRELAHDLAVHIAFAKPLYLTRDEVPEAEIEAEKATVIEIGRNEGKPEAAMEKIVQGRMNGWFKERCLMEQNYAKDEKQTIASIVGSARVVSFAQVIIGS